MTNNDIYAQLERLNYVLPQIMKRILLSAGEKTPYADINFSHHRLLWMLAFYGEMGMKDLADKISVTMPTITESVDQMVELGYVERYSDSKDRRRVMVRMTNSGKKIISDCENCREAIFKEIFEKLSQEDRSRLIQSLEAIYTIFSKLESGVKIHE